MLFSSWMLRRLVCTPTFNLIVMILFYYFFLFSALLQSILVFNKNYEFAAVQPIDSTVNIRKSNTNMQPCIHVHVVHAYNFTEFLIYVYGFLSPNVEFRRTNWSIQCINRIKLSPTRLSWALPFAVWWSGLFSMYLIRSFDGEIEKKMKQQQLRV